MYDLDGSALRRLSPHSHHVLHYLVCSTVLPGNSLSALPSASSCLNVTRLPNLGLVQRPPPLLLRRDPITPGAPRKASDPDSGVSVGATVVLPLAYQPFCAFFPYGLTPFSPRAAMALGRRRRLSANNTMAPIIAKAKMAAPIAIPAVAPLLSLRDRSVDDESDELVMPGAAVGFLVLVVSGAVGAPVRVETGTG